MEAVSFLASLLLLVTLLAMTIALFVRLDAMKKRIGRLESEVARLRHPGGSPADGTTSGAPAVALPASASPPLPPTAPATPAPLPGPPAAATAWTAPPAPPTAPERRIPPARPSFRAAPAGHAPLDPANLEQLVGGVWLQNLGSVVLLLGAFLMIV